MSAICARRCTTGCSRARRAGGSCCGSTTPMPSGRRSGSSTRSGPISTGWGSTPDAEVRQSARFDVYEARFASWSRRGGCTRPTRRAQELDLKRKVQLGRGLPPIYDRAALALSDAERARAGGGRRAAALAVPARSRRADRMGRSGPRDPAVRPGDDERPGGAAGGRVVAVHAAQRDRRCRDGRDAMSCAARTMSRTPRCSCRCSRRWARRRRASRMRRC